MRPATDLVAPFAQGQQGPDLTSGVGRLGLPARLGCGPRDIRARFAEQAGELPKPEFDQVCSWRQAKIRGRDPFQLEVESPTV